MPLILGEQPIIDALNIAFSYFKANVSILVPEIFAYASAQDQADIIALWGPKYNPSITTGYPLKPPQSPMIAITNEPEKETEQYASMAGTGIYFNGGPVYAGEFETVYYCHCFAVNQKQLLWLQVMVKWSLLAQRIPLMQGMTSSGLPTGYFNKQKVSASGLMASKNLSGDSVAVFERVVSLTATHLDTWTGLESYSIYEGGTMAITEAATTINIGS